MPHTLLLRDLDTQVEAFLSEYTKLYTKWLGYQGLEQSREWGLDVGMVWLSGTDLIKEMQVFGERLLTLQTDSFATLQSHEQPYFICLHAYFQSIVLNLGSFLDVTQAQYEESKEPNQLTDDQRQILFDTLEEAESVRKSVQQVYEQTMQDTKAPLQADIEQDSTITANSAVFETLRAIVPHVYWIMLGIAPEDDVNAARIARYGDEALALADELSHLNEARLKQAGTLRSLLSRKPVDYKGMMEQANSLLKRVRLLSTRIGYIEPGDIPFSEREISWVNEIAEFTEKLRMASSCFALLTEYQFQLSQGEKGNSGGSLDVKWQKFRQYESAYRDASNAIRRAGTEFYIIHSGNKRNGVLTLNKTILDELRSEMSEEDWKKLGLD